ncbi:MAG: flagellar protein FlaG [Nitrospirae bacterium]|nr:flagellar protein FlaG [Nitrospirota bacterium]
MVDTIAGIMPVGLAIRVGMPGVVYELARDMSGQSDSSVVGGIAGQGAKWSENDDVVIKGGAESDNTEIKQINDLKRFVNKETDDKNAADGHQSKAYFEIDEDDKVIIKVVDAEGKLLKQIPPDDYKKSVRRLEEAYNKLFHKEV